MQLGYLSPNHIILSSCRISVVKQALAIAPTYLSITRRLLPLADLGSCKATQSVAMNKYEKTRSKAHFDGIHFTSLDEARKIAHKGDQTYATFCFLFERIQD